MSEQLVADVADIVAHALGERPSAVQPRRGGLIHRVYEAQLAQRAVIVRLNPEARRLAGMVRNLGVLSELGLPVPKLLASGIEPSPFGVGFLILERIPGVDLGLEIERMTDAQLAVLADQIVAAQRKVGGLPRGRGYGYVPVGDPGPYPSWPTLLLEQWEQHLSHVPGWLTRALQERVLAMLDRLAPYFRQIPPVCFLDDLTTKNVMVEAGRLTGFVDFDWVGYGDPLDMVGLTKLSVLLNCGEQGRAYIRELCRGWGVPDALKPVIDAYAVVHSPCFAREWSERGDPDGVRRVLEVTQALLASAERGDPRGMRPTHLAGSAAG